jgi:ketol-acid reductoisomerase
MTMYFEKDASLKPLQGKTVAIIGYGSQGRAHANNLHDSGIDVVVGARPNGASWMLAKQDGLAVATPAEAAAKADVISILMPDMVQPKVFEEAILPNAGPESILFAHGFTFTSARSRCDTMDVIIQQKGPGDLVRAVPGRQGRALPDGGTSGRLRPGI